MRRQTARLLRGIARRLDQPKGRPRAAARAPGETPAPIVDPLATRPTAARLAAGIGSASPSRLAVTALPPVSPHTSRLEIFVDLVRTMRPGRMLDLATGHGRFAIAAQQLGWTVTGVDARTERMPGVEGITWIQGDVRTFPLDGYDLITMLGLLYHLELDDQLDLLKRAAGTLTVIDTHIAPNPKTVEQGYEGQYFDEKTEELTASVGNVRSFWPHPDAFIRMLWDCGYRDVYVLTPGHHPSRTFYLCI